MFRPDGSGSPVGGFRHRLLNRKYGLNMEKGAEVLPPGRGSVNGYPARSRPQRVATAGTSRGARKVKASKPAMTPMVAEATNIQT